MIATLVMCLALVGASDDKVEVDYLDVPAKSVSASTEPKIELGYSAETQPTKRTLSQEEFKKQLKEDQDKIRKTYMETGHYPLQPTINGGMAEAPPLGAHFCPKCGKGPYLKVCECGFKARTNNALDRTPTEWKEVLHFCPFCSSELFYFNGCMKCKTCPSRFVIDFDNMDPSLNHDPEPHNSREMPELPDTPNNRDRSKIITQDPATDPYVLNLKRMYEESDKKFAANKQRHYDEQEPQYKVAPRQPQPQQAPQNYQQPPQYPPNYQRPPQYQQQQRPPIEYQQQPRYIQACPPGASS